MSVSLDRMAVMLTPLYALPSGTVAVISIKAGMSDAVRVLDGARACGVELFASVPIGGRWFNCIALVSV